MKQIKSKTDKTSEMIMTDEVEFEIGAIVFVTQSRFRYCSMPYRRMTSLSTETAYVITNKTLTPCPPSRDRSFDIYYYSYEICATDDPSKVFFPFFSTHLTELNT